MVFYPPEFVPKIDEVPDTLPICDFILNEEHGRRPYSQSWDTYTCGLSGKSIKAQDQKTQVDHLSRALAKELGWKVNEGTEMDKVAGVFALNTVRWQDLPRATHGLMITRSIS